MALSDHPDPLLDTPYAQRIVDAQGLNELFALGPARTPGKTPLRDVMALEPGCCLAADRRGVRVWRYFAPRARPHEDSPEATVQTVRAMLERAVEEIPESVDGAMLSGGLDSTALMVLLHAKGRPMRTFSVDYQGDLTEFTGNAYQPERDRDYAAMAAELFSREHKNIVLDYQALTGSLGQALDARGFPGMGDIDSSMLLFAREIRRDCAGVVSGEGGDEVFCGYPWFKEENLTLEKGFPWSGSMDLRRALLRRDAEEVLKVKKYADQAFKNALDMVPRVSGEGKMDAANRAMQWLCIRFFMSNLQERALCMCESADLEVITPFTDERLVEYLWNVPRELKFMNGEGKGLLREAVKDLLPDTLLHRKKSPYPKVYSKAYTDTLRQSVRAMASAPQCAHFAGGGFPGAFAALSGGAARRWPALVRAIDVRAPDAGLPVAGEPVAGNPAHPHQSVNSGVWGLPSLSSSKCRWGPSAASARALVPTLPMVAPCFTVSPGSAISSVPRQAYRLTQPPEWVISTV